MGNFYTETTFSTGSCNSTPVFVGYPEEPAFCAQTGGQYPMSVIDREGDSLVYSFVQPKTGPQTYATYAPGYSVTQMMPNTTIDPNTGLITVGQVSLIGMWDMAVQVEEYDSNGNLMSTSVRDTRFHSNICGTMQTPPAPTSPGITNLTGSPGMNQLDSNSIEVCPGGNFCFDVVFSEPVLGLPLSMSSNIDSILTGVSITYTGTNPVTATVCGTAQGNPNSWEHFRILAQNDSCPIPGSLALEIDLHFTSGTYAGPDQGICAGSSVQLNGSGGTTQTWSVISGPPMVVGTNFSCNPCANPIASPSATTTYLLTTNSNGCSNTDSVTITVSPQAGANITTPSINVCGGDSVQLTGTGGTIQTWSLLGGGPFQIGTNITCNPCANPVVFPSGPTTYVLTTNNTSGCGSSDTITINATNAYIVSLFSPTSICDQDSVQMSPFITQNVPLTFNWSPGSWFSDSTIAYPIVSFPGPGTHTIHFEATDTNGCIQSDSLVTTVHPIPPLSVSNDTSLCLGDSVQLNATGTGTFLWSPPASLNNPAIANPVATPSVSTAYSVVLIDSNGCSNSDTVLVGVVPNTSVSGFINQSNGSPLSNTTVYLIKYFPGNDSVAAIDTVTTNALGYYIFTTMEPVVYVKAAPDSTVYPNELPTYYDTSAVFQGADSVLVIPCDSNLTSFSTLAGSNPGGPGFVGGIVSQGAGKTEGVGDPIANLALVLVDESGEELQYTVTDQNGQFLFGGLAYGNYSVWVDKAGIDNALGPLISVADDRDTDSLLFSLHSFYLELHPPIGQPEIPEAIHDLKIAPNPNRGSFLLSLHTSQEAGVVQISVMDILGNQLMMKKVSGNGNLIREEINLEGIHSGLYFVQVEAGNRIISEKVVVGR